MWKPMFFNGSRIPRRLLSLSTDGYHYFLPTISSGDCGGSWVDNRFFSTMFWQISFRRTVTSGGASIPRRTCFPRTLTTQTHICSPMAMHSPIFLVRVNIGALLGKIARGKSNSDINCPPDVREIARAPRGSLIPKRYWSSNCCWTVLQCHLVPV